MARAAETTEVKVYLVALDDNGKNGIWFGCDDSLIPVNRTVQPTGAPLTAALDQLLAMPEEYNQGGLHLWNDWKGTNLKVKSVSIKNGTATIHITGRLNLGGTCAAPRIKEQIRTTARQFRAVKKVNVFVNGTLLEEILRVDD